MNRKGLVFGIFVTVGVLTTTVTAQRVGESVTIDEPQFSDQYAAGRVVRVSAPIDGDLVIAGQELVVDARVSGDLIAAGDSLDLRGSISDDLRAAGRVLTLNAQILGHVVGAGQEIVLDAGASVGDWAWFAGQTVTVEGDVGAELRVAGQSVEISGEIGGDAVLVAEEIRIAPGAIIRGDLIWESDTEPEIAPGATVDGRIIEEDLTEGFDGMTVFRERDGVAGALLFAIALIAGALAMFLGFPRFSRAVAGRIRTKPFRTLGLGLGVIAGTPLVAALLFMTRIGWIVGIGTLFGYLLLLLSAILFGVVIVGELGLHLSMKEGAARRSIELLAIVLGVILFLLLAQIPVLGTIIVLLVLIGGLGAVSGELFQRYRQPAH